MEDAEVEDDVVDVEEGLAAVATMRGGAAAAAALVTPPFPADDPAEGAKLSKGFVDCCCCV